MAANETWLPTRHGYQPDIAANAPRPQKNNGGMTINSFLLSEHAPSNTTNNLIGFLGCFGDDPLGVIALGLASGSVRKGIQQPLLDQPHSLLQAASHRSSWRKPRFPAISFGKGTTSESGKRD
jgi:hypothetical protein